MTAASKVLETTRPTIAGDCGVWAFLVCDDYPVACDAELAECHDCHDLDYPHAADQRWQYEEPEVGMSCSHCGLHIVEAEEQE